ncbi:MAG TPA: DUF4388 domain-containing protein [Candidatus Deferrimicrobiaceae bacterium]
MQGKISDFAIPDIFQLISSQQKSGALSIRGDDRETVFHFADGQIVGVSPDERRAQKGMLGNMLADAGFLSGEEVRKLLSAQQKTGRKLGEILTDEGKISREDLSRYLALQVKESLFFALRIREGDYRFESFAVRPPPWMRAPLRSDILLMEGMQFLDEYPLIRGKFPPGMFQISRKKGEKIDPAGLSDEERRLWKNIDFSTDPWRVFRKGCVSWYEGVKALAALQDRGLVRVTPVETVSDAEDPVARLRAELARRHQLARVKAGCWGAAALVAAWWLYATFLSPLATHSFANWVRFF